MTRPIDRWFWIDAAGLVVSAALLAASVWSELDGHGRAMGSAMLFAVFAVRLARRISAGAATPH